MSGIPAPPVFDAGPSPAAMLALWGALALAAFAYAAVLAVRERDVLPVAVCAGALVCALNEPIYDTLAKLVYARVPSGYVAYSAFGRQIPWTLVIGYVPWVGLVPYLLSRRMEAGVSRAGLHRIALALTVSVALVELVNSVWLHDWRYYGGHSARGVLGGGIVQMSAMPILCGFLLCVFARPASGVRRALLGVLIPTMALPIVFAATSWPLYVSNYATMPDALHWAAAGVTIGFCVLAVLAVSYLAEQRSPTMAKARA
ncbi:MAG: hypothetical protein JWN32_777 [Solirubrobacterales bacterium]|nr:hypothetical protein [Solirubrobacterales bacterium]